MPVKRVHRISAWNIGVITKPPQPTCGFYQANGALTYGTIFEDLFTCFPKLDDPDVRLILALGHEHETLTGEGQATGTVTFIPQR